MGWIQSLLLALSLCADCFAVTLCSGVTLRKLTFGHVLGISCIFAVIHVSLLIAGLVLGQMLSAFFIKAANIIGFLLLLYVGGSMLVEGIRGKEESRNLNVFRQILLAGLATSMDALAVGFANSVDGDPLGSFLVLIGVLFVVTIVTVAAGIYSGKAIGARTGLVAEIIGGLVIIGLGVTLLF